MKFGLLMLLLGLAPASARECTALEAYAAETVVDYVESWKKLHAAYKEFAHCDDGSIAEGFSYVVARLMVDQWPRIPEFSSLAKRDPGFQKFVLRHIDATWGIKDRKVVVNLAASKCSKADRSVCREILNAAMAPD